MPSHPSFHDRFRRSPIPAIAVLLLCLLTGPLPALAQEEVGEFSNDWTGNELKVVAVRDPEVEGVTCHIVHFDRSVIDRLSKGNWFEDPSNASIACRQTGPIVINDIETSKRGEEVFSERKSLVFKALAVRRIYDRANDSLIYVVYSRQVTDASANMAISTVPLFAANPTWSKGKPR